MKTTRKQLQKKVVFRFKKSADKMVVTTDPTTATISNIPTCPGRMVQ